MGKRNRLYAAIDVGGTKIFADLVEPSGVIRARLKRPTPRDGGPEAVVAAIEDALRTVLDGPACAAAGGVAAIGVGIPGVVDPERGLVVGTPNMGLVDCPLGPHLEALFGVPVALGNDCNLGALGEKWLGSARRAASVMTIMVGTGIGGGFVQKSRPWRGAREAAAEIGHIVMEIGGPPCGCGNRGCLEALASRGAIERQLREALASGRPSLLPELLGNDLSVIRSSVLREALRRGDALVTDVVRRAAEVLGHACLTVRHLLDPEVIILGGGVIAACGEWIVPIVQTVVESDRLPGAREGGHVLVSALGDDAVVLGAAALAQWRVGENPLKGDGAVSPLYPQIVAGASGELYVGQKTYRRGLYVTVGAKVKSLKEMLDAETDAPLQIAPEHLAKTCRGGPEVLFIGTGRGEQVDMTSEAAEFLRQRAIRWRAMPTDEAVAAYNRSKKRRAAILRAR